MNAETPRSFAQPVELFVAGNGYLSMNDAQKTKIETMIRNAAGLKRLQVSLDAQWNRAESRAVWMLSYKGTGELKPLDIVGLLGSIGTVLSDPVIRAEQVFTGIIPRLSGTERAARPLPTPRPPFS